MIKIVQNGKILAEHTTDSPLSHYGQAVWTILEPEPIPVAAMWIQGVVKQWIEILQVKDGWLVVKQADGLLCAIIWSDGTYYANLIVDADDKPVRELQDGLHVRGTVPLGGLGSILPIDENIPIDEPGQGDPVMRTLDKPHFELEMNRARSMIVAGQDVNYWNSYQRGLRRAFHGLAFGTPGEHEKWLDAALSDDPQRAARGRGYRDGLKGECR